MASPAEIAWAAGLFEGEGSATISSGQRQPRLQMTMTDEDVVRRFARIVGRGTIRRYEARGYGTKSQWYWAVHSGPDVVAVSDLLLPHLGERRTARVDEVRDVARAIGKPRDGGGGIYSSGRCKRGHDLNDPTHQYLHAGKRYCRTCRLRREATYRAKRRVS